MNSKSAGRKDWFVATINQLINTFVKTKVLQVLSNLRNFYRQFRRSYVGEIFTIIKIRWTNHTVNDDLAIQKNKKKFFEGEKMEKNRVIKKRMNGVTFK